MSQDGLSSDRVDIVVEPDAAGARLDSFLTERFPEYSRAHVRRIIDAAGVLVDGKRPKVSYRLKEGQRVSLTLPALPRVGPEPENIPLEVLFEDEHLVAINKPPNMVVHPSKGHWSGTLTAALSYHFESLSTVGGPTRPGIVHRLDRETSGVIVVAKTDQAHVGIASQFEARTTTKLYLAIVAGKLDRDRDRIDQPIGAHPHQRDKMAIRADHPTSRSAQTFYEVRERFPGYAVVLVTPKTGRTHQIRVHLAHIRCPVLCDRLYGGRSSITIGQILGTDDDTILLARQALHAKRLEIRHPITDEPLAIEAPVPDDLNRVLEALRGV